MLSNIFVKVLPLLKEKKFANPDQFVTFMGKYHSGNWVYPSALHRELKLDIRMVYELLEACRKDGLLKQYLQIYCPNCQKYSGFCYESITEIPESIECQQCGRQVANPIHHAAVVYKVL